MEKNPIAVMYCCDVCGYLTRTKRVFQDHATVHQGVKNHLCTFAGCTALFKVGRSLKRHIERKHPRINDV